METVDKTLRFSHYYYYFFFENISAIKLDYEHAYPSFLFLFFIFRVKTQNALN